VLMVPQGNTEHGLVLSWSLIFDPTPARAG
jgi:hypothetical protein